MMLFGVIGYLMKKFDYEAAPLVLAFVLGPMLEETLRQSLIMFGGKFPDLLLAAPVRGVRDFHRGAAYFPPCQTVQAVEGGTHRGGWDGAYNMLGSDIGGCVKEKSMADSGDRVTVRERCAPRSWRERGLSLQATALPRWPGRRY